MLEQLFGGGERGTKAMDVVAHPEKVEAYLLEHRNDGRSVPLFGWSQRMGPVEVGDKTAATLASVILDSNSYVWETIRMCQPDYDVQVSFYAKASRVDIAFSFDCVLLAVALDGHIVNVDEFDPAEEVILNEIKELFPDDKRIRYIVPRSMR